MIKDAEAHAAAVSFDGTTFREPPQRFEAGTPPIIEGIGLGDLVMRIGAGEAPATLSALGACTNVAETPLGESPDEALVKLARAVAAHPGGRVVVVCHGVVCKVLLLSLLRGYGPEDWATIGRVVNLAVSEIVPDGDLWAARQLLVVPAPVAEVNAAFAEPGVRKTEA